jgi:hypothetical protein
MFMERIKQLKEEQKLSLHKIEANAVIEKDISQSLPNFLQADKDKLLVFMVCQSSYGNDGR